MSSSHTNPASQNSADAISSSTANVVERNVRALVEHAAEQERTKSTSDRVAAAISAFAGSMKFVYFHAVAFGLWTAVDMGWVPAVHNFDPSFTKLGTLASVEAIFLATFVLITQNRMAAQEEIRNRLAVQMSLLNEHETTHILRLVVAMSDRMELREAGDPEIQELLRDVEPQDMIDRIAVHSDAVKEEIREDKSGR
ncbi:MAG: DUF1003 domain-containing protein [Gemmatimonadaceae bacterium]|nr:DUF1003 domain-containing protein [Gemmatimonadaceae bacterium]